MFTHIIDAVLADLRTKQLQKQFLFQPTPNLAAYGVGNHLVVSHEAFDEYLLSIKQTLAGKGIATDSYDQLYKMFPKDFILLLGIDRSFWHKQDFHNKCPCGDPRTSSKSITSSGRPYVE